MPLPPFTLPAGMDGPGAKQMPPGTNSAGLISAGPEEVLSGNEEGTRDEEGSHPNRSEPHAKGTHSRERGRARAGRGATAPRWHDVFVTRGPCTVTRPPFTPSRRSTTAAATGPGKVPARH